ncbi:prolyl oligopeptidase family serine peptidase [Microbacterium fluvii]|uniref:Prolyl oligopeptidase family serine peptidase n=1 Tax=Microbacterium fluvii TaxID=415215 RepID=A0ABW2HFY8_9MICO|nr:prolyl oligopeptidase family serine peptidase [Microbacterium fluvii]MCU4673508.1 prolyl oligopeptidase family serine peptidase [Microbacterium fluvii]
MPQILPFGSWPSPLSADSVAAASPRIDGARFVGDDIWWGETVAHEGGRTAVRRRGADGAVTDVLPAPWSARSRVHEYGGGSWTTTADGALLFVEKSDQRVWMLRPGAEPTPLTPALGGMRFGGLAYTAGRLIAVRETHDGTGGVSRDLVDIPLDGSATANPGALRFLVADSDFVAQPALSPSGDLLAWIAWDHPDMAWDRSELRVGRIEDGTVAEWTTVAGGASSPLQPMWVGDADLVFVDDPTGRWNLWRVHLNAGLEVHPVAPADADTGGPLWVLGPRWFAPLDDGRTVAVRTNGADELVLIDPEGSAVPVPLPVSADVTIDDVQGTRVLLSGAGPAAMPGLWLVDLDDPTGAAAVRGGEAPWGAEWMPRPRAATYDGPHGPVHAFDYPPTNPDAAAPADERPPYVVFVHGGPTSHVAGAASGRIAYLTSRGIGVLDVNYGGSTGYGRAYRERLRGQWGIADVDDVVAAARGLIAEGAADPARIGIAGGSAGGWTVLCALVGSDVFSAGISRYGVADLRLLAADTHDYESRYLDGLVGPLPVAEQVYIERSPLSHLEHLRTPLLIEQGLDDEVVPPAQSEAVRDALAARGVPHAYLAFEGEGHGFRRAETLIATMEAEVGFLGAVLGFAPDALPPLPLD